MSGKTGPEAKGPDFNKALLVILKISFLMVKTVLRIPWVDNDFQILSFLSVRL